jgi:SH3-like domain-containing protein
MKRLIFLFTIVFCTGSLVFSQTAGNRRYVAVQSTVMKDSTGFFARELGRLSLGTELTLIRENGKWSEVRAGNLSGWVASSSLSARRVIVSGTTPSAGEITLAGKGFSPDVEIEYRRNGLDYSTVDAMEQMVIPVDDLLRFVTEGRLSRGE